MGALGSGVQTCALPISIILWHHLDEAGDGVLPIVEQGGGPCAARVEQMTFQQNPKPLRIVTQDVAHAAIVYIQRALLRAMTVVIVGIGPDRLDIHHRHVAALAEKAIVARNIGDAARPSRPEVAPPLPPPRAAPTRQYSP